MVHSRPMLPSGHGELTVRPDLAEWEALLTSNRAMMSSWTFMVGGMPVGAVRRVARAEAIHVAEGFSAKLGVDLRAAGPSDEPIVATGHQPEIYHPGVWVKDFLLDRIASQSGATALDVVVDTDGFDTVAVTSPCMTSGMDRCRQYLAVGAPGSCFASTPVPSVRDVDDFCRSADEMLATLPAPAVRRHFSVFCGHLKRAMADANNIAELVTIARRRYESSAGTGYLEAPMTGLAQTSAFRRFVAQLALDASAFAQAYNSELHEYRAFTKTRSAAQPVPDLKSRDGDTELPFWLIADGIRSTLWVRAVADGRLKLLSDSGVVIELPADPSGIVEGLAQQEVLIAPKALALTMFVRMFVCDLFIHGIGGGRYDRVTDGVIRRYFGVEPPSFVVASLTMYLPLGAHVVGEDEVAAAKERLNRLEHNPDALLSEIDFDTTDEHDQAVALATEKRALVASIALPDADKKQLGLRIREVNGALSSILAPLRAEYQADLDHLQGQLKVSDILTDRTYPFCFWDPGEVADKLP